MTRERTIVLGRSALAAQAESLLDAVAARGHDGGEFVRLAGGGSSDYYLKGGPLRGEAALRHGLRRLVRRKLPPRLREYENLAALRANGFAAPEPIFAAARVTRTRVLAQLLVTARVANAAGYEALLASPGAAERPRALAALARELARFHAAGFEHRDLYARNLLFAMRGDACTPVVLDLWRGGLQPAWRRNRDLAGRVARDLGLLFTDLAPALSIEEQATFLANYLAAPHQSGGALGERLSPTQLRVAIERAYRREVAGLAERPARRRGKPLPSPDWRAPAEPFSS